MAQAYRRFGSRVTVIETGPQLMTREDPDVADEMQRILSDEGIQFLLAGANSQCAAAGPEKRSALRCARPPASRRSRAATSWSRRGAFPTPPGSGSRRPASSWTLAATFASMSGWRRPRPMSGRSANVPAARSSRTSPIDDFRIIRDNLAGGNRSTRDRLVPYCMFTDPPLAHVGLSEREAQRQGVAVRVARLPMSAVLRTHDDRRNARLHEGPRRRSDDRILGFTMIGAEAGEVMAVVQTAMLAELAIPAASRRGHRASDDGGGARPALRERAGGAEPARTARC